MLEAGVYFGGTYRLEKSLGRGGMGEVWLAHHVLLNEPRAIKVMLGILTSDATIRERFIQGEARNTLRLDRHPNIVRVYDLGLHETMPFIVMEYVKGSSYGASLKELLRHHERFTLEQTRFVLEQLTSGLEVAHRLGLVHRDLKPANILVDRDTEDGPIVKLSDFGLTKDLENGPDLTSLGYALGTPAYMSPEQALGQAEPRSDQYSLGAIIYELLTGHPPFTGIAASLILQHATEPPPPMQYYNRNIPQEVSAVVLKALAKHPDDRCPSVTDFYRAYEQALNVYKNQTASDTVALPMEGHLTGTTKPLSPISSQGGRMATIIPPSGTLTFLFTDIEGSTRLWEQFPDAMRPALERHDTLLRQAIEAEGGYVFKTVGDAFCAAFSAPMAAVTAALNGLRRLAAETWGETGLLKVRMALHTGTAEERDGDYFGPTLNRVARLLSAGHGNQVLVSAATQQIIRDSSQGGGFELRDLGLHRLKDLTQPEHIFQIDTPDLAEQFDPLKTLNNRTTNLPPQPTALVGRDREVGEVCALLSQAEIRLVTLLGPGGTGKTRLSLQVAADLLDTYPDGAFSVPLEPVNDPALLLPTIAQTLGVKESELPLVERLKAYLTDKQLLLVLDNFEQVVGGASLIADLLKVAPKLKGLVSSRIPLRLYGEREYAVPPLGLPALKRLPSVADLAHFPAVALFVQRAQAVKADFSLTPENAAAVAEICVRLDGLPLAIELASARVKLLPPQAMLSRLSNRLKLLTGGARDLTSRQQTLRGAIDWSYDLLEEAERKFFARLGVFNGGWSLDAAETVCTFDDLEIDVLDGLGSLLDKSLLRQEDSTGLDGEPRFFMLETIREYALDKLTEFGEAEATNLRHAQYFLSFAQTNQKELTGPQELAALKRLELEHDNFRAALNWAITSGSHPLSPSIALQLVGALWRFWVKNSYLSEGRRWLETALTKVADPELATERARVLTGAGNLAWVQGDYEQATDWLNQSLALRRELDDKSGMAATLQNLGNMALEHEDYEGATALYTETLAVRRELGDKSEIAIALQNLGNVALEQDDYTQAIALFEEGLTLFKGLNNKKAMAAVQQSLKVATARQGR